MIIICKRCDYEWTSRVKCPKECPRCKNRIDYSKESAKKDKNS